MTSSEAKNVNAMSNENIVDEALNYGDEFQFEDKVNGSDSGENI
jgi:hypothetical protein